MEDELDCLQQQAKHSLPCGETPASCQSTVLHASCSVLYDDAASTMTYHVTQVLSHSVFQSACQANFLQTQ